MRYLLLEMFDSSEQTDGGRRVEPDCLPCLVYVLHVRPSALQAHRLIALERPRTFGRFKVPSFCFCLLSAEYPAGLLRGGSREGGSALIDCLSTGSTLGERRMLPARAPSAAFTGGSAWSYSKSKLLFSRQGFSPRATPLWTSCVYLHASTSKSSVTSAEEAADVCRICQVSATSRAAVCVCLWVAAKERGRA